jgi:hypothetical protein
MDLVNVPLTASPTGGIQKKDRVFSESAQRLAAT